MVSYTNQLKFDRRAAFIEKLVSSPNLAIALLLIPSRSADILRWRFGMDGHEKHTRRQVAERLGLSVARINQLEVKALVQLEHPSRASQWMGGINDQAY